MSEETKVAVSEEMEKFISYIEKLTVLELSQLVKALEQRLGVSAAAPAAAAAAPGAAAAPKAEEQTEFTVVLVKTGDNKISVIKEVRTLTSLGLKEAKELVDGAPKPIKEGVAKADAEKMKAQLEAVGATVELK